MSKRKKPYEKKMFESTGAPADTFATVYQTMLLSPAFQSLTHSQRLLYLYCKARYYAEKRHPGGDPEAFYMNRALWADLYKIYDRENAKGFRRDRDALVEKGFITIVEHGQATRTKTVYRFSSMWQKYGTAAFCVPGKGPPKRGLPMANIY